MTGLKNDETSVGDLYEDCKRIVKSILLFGDFLDALVEFIQGGIVASSQTFEITLPAAQKSQRDKGVTCQDYENQDQQNHKKSR